MNMVVHLKNVIIYNLWIVHVQSPITFPNLCEKLVFNVVCVIFKFESPKKKTHKIQKSNAPSKTFKKDTFGTKRLKNKQKLQLIWTYENKVKF